MQKAGRLALMLTLCMPLVLGAQMQSGGSMQMPMGGMNSPARTAAPAGPLKVTYGDKSAEFSAEKIAAMPHTSVTALNERTRANQTYSGVVLMDLLTQVGAPNSTMGKGLSLYVVAEGADGYKVVFSIGEVTPALTGSTVMVADSLDGKPVPLQLVVSGDKHPSRWVRNLAAIRVMPAQ